MNKVYFLQRLELILDKDSINENLELIHSFNEWMYKYILDCIASGFSIEQAYLMVTSINNEIPKIPARFDDLFYLSLRVQSILKNTK